MELTLSQAINGFLLHKEIEGASPHTLRNYRLTLRRFAASLPADPPLATITIDQTRTYLHQFQTTQLTPAGIAPRKPKLPAPKTVRNEHTALASLWSWAVAEGYAAQNIIQSIKAPRPSDPDIQPLIQAEVQALLQATQLTAPWRTNPKTRSGRPQHLRRRDRALILFLLDTGVRASELCSLRTAHLDLKTGIATIKGKSRLNSGQGKTRTVHVGNRCRKALWEYLLPPAGGGWEGGEFVFTTTTGTPLDRRHLGRHLKRIGQRAGLKNITPHRLRHTFAINYLRNGGDIYTLQSILGHTSLDMVRRYLKIAEADCAQAHRKASPVDNWNL